MYLTNDEMLYCHQPSPILMERRWKSNVELAPNCPRCASSNTKFCYYNNYSLSQPRYFCKGCRRYWTKGGSLRSVPVGGGCRKTRRTKSVRTSGGGGTTAGSDEGSLSTGLHANDPSSSGLPSSGTNGPDIDLAVVFAKYVNHTEQSNQLSDISGSPSQDTRLDDMLAECQMQSSTSDEGELVFPGLGEGFPCGDHILEEGHVQEFLGDDSNTFGLQSVLSDELAQDLMWPDSTTLTNFSWQPMLPLQEFGSFPCDDQSKISSNVIDNWSLLDLPGI